MRRAHHEGGPLKHESWDQYSVAREKATFTIANLLICVLVPAWSIADFLLEPEVALRFLALRAIDVGVTLVLWWLIARSSDLLRNRLAMAASMTAVGLTIAAMMPELRGHYALYVFGFSLVFWGCGSLLILPVRWAAASFGLALAAYVAGYVVFGGDVAPEDFAGFLVYMASAAIISCAQMVVRRRLEREAWNAADALRERNDELGNTVAKLGATQARLVAASAVLAESLDVEETAARVVELSVPAFGSFALLSWQEPDGEVTCAVEHVEPSQRRALREALAATPPPGGRDGCAVEHVTRATPEDLERIAGPAVRGVVTARSIVAAPLVARGQRAGTLVLGHEGRDYEPHEVAFAEEMAHRAALALDNARLFRDAGEAVRLRDDFISVAGHELRTPLSPIRLTVDMLLRSPAPDDRTRRLLVKLDGQVARISGLVTQLLDVSKLAAGALVLERERMDLAELARDVARQFEEDAAKLSSSIEVAAPEPVIGVWDRLRLEQVVGNLLSNAIKYGRGRPVRVEVTRRGTQAVLAVADEGIGIAKEDQARIWDRFGRAVSTRHYGGFGLGLWIVARIVEELGGSVRVESTVGKGSRFTVELPESAPVPS